MTPPLSTFPAGSHPAKASCLLPHRPISRARRVAGRRAGLGGEVRRPVAVAHLQSRHGTGESPDPVNEIQPVPLWRPQ